MLTGQWVLWSIRVWMTVMCPSGSNHLSASVTVNQCHFLSFCLIWLRFLFFDGGRDGHQSSFSVSFLNTPKQYQKRFHVVFSEISVKASKQARNATGLAQERGCLNLSQLETVCVPAGKKLPTIVGNRPNKLHQGTTASNVLMQVGV